MSDEKKQINKFAVGDLVVRSALGYDSISELRRDGVVRRYLVHTVKYKGPAELIWVTLADDPKGMKLRSGTQRKGKVFGPYGAEMFDKVDKHATPIDEKIEAVAKVMGW
jgi:hypothetical protein